MKYHYHLVKVHSSTIWKPYSIEIGKGYLHGKHLQENKTIGKSQVWVKVRRMEPISQEKIKIYHQIKSLRTILRTIRK